MRRGLKSKYILFILSLFMIVGVFLPRGGALAKEAAKKAAKDAAKDKYTIDLNIGIKNKEELKKKLDNGQSIEASNRDVKVYKLKVEKDLTDADRLKLAKELDGLTIAKAEEKLKDFIEKKVASEKSKYFYDGKGYDVIDKNAIKDFKLEKLDLDNEKIEIKDLDAGYYLIKETDESKSMAKYKLVTQVVKLPSEQMQDKKLIIVAKKEEDVKENPKNIKLIKVDAINKDVKLDQAQFELYKKVENGKAQLVKVDGSRGNYSFNENGKTTALETWNGGEIVVQNLPEGTYYFKEIKPAPGYPEEGNKNKASKDVKLGGTVTVENYRRPLLQKVDKDNENKTLDGAVFEIYKKDDNKKLNFKKTDTGYEVDPNGKDELITKDGGLLNITNLEDGTYVIKEVRAPEKYVLEKIEEEFTVKGFNAVDKEGKARILLIKNKLKPEPNKPTPNEPPTPDEPKTPKGGYHFVKIDSSKKENRLAGAKFVLMKKEGASFKEMLKDGKRITLTSPDNGEFSIDGLEYGEYALKEIEAPKNHTISQELTPFTVDAASNLEPAKKIVNEPYVPTTVTSRQNTITTRHVPGEITRIVKNPLVKTGDIRIVVMAIIGIILTIMGIRFVNAGERKQRI